MRGGDRGTSHHGIPPEAGVFVMVALCIVLAAGIGVLVMAS